ncbi:TPA: hypothetical protein ACIH53_005268, partial [Salmonella enterica subsp. enterica serovar Typhimurium]
DKFITTDYLQQCHLEQWQGLRQFAPLPSPVVRLSPASDRHPAGCQKPEIQKLELRYLFS